MSFSQYSLLPTPKGLVTPEEYLRQRLEHYLPDEQGKEELIALLLPLLAMGARPSAATWQGLREEVAQAVVLALKDDAERHWGVSWDGSLERANQIIAIGEVRIDLAIQALGIMAKGDALKHVTGRIQEAWGYLEQAGYLYLQSNLAAHEREIGWARTRIGRLYIAVEVNEVGQALEEAEEASRILERYQVWNRLISLHINWGATYNNLYEFRQSLAQYQYALALAEKLGAAGNPYLATIYNDMAIAERWLGLNHEAMAHFQQAAIAFEERGATSAYAITQMNLGAYHMVRGDYDRAMKLLFRAEDLLKERNPAKWLLTICNLVECYLHLNRFEEGRDLAEEILAQQITPLESFARARIVFHLALAYRYLHQHAKALELLNEAEQTLIHLGATQYAAEMQLERANVLLEVGDLSEAQTLSRTVAETTTDHIGGHVHIKAIVADSVALFRQQEMVAAYQMAAQGARLARRGNFRHARYDAHLIQGQAAQLLNRTLRAKRHYRMALALSGDIQRGVGYTFQADIGETHQAPLHHLVAFALREGQTAQAIQLLETAKNRLFLTYLQRAELLRWDENSETIPLLDELARLRAQQSENRRKAILSTGEKADLDVKDARIRHLTDRLYLHTQSQTLSSPDIPPVSMIQTGLISEEVMLIYYDDGMQVWSFVISDERVWVYPITVGRAELVEWVEAIRENTNSTLRTSKPDDLVSRVQAKKVRRLYTLLGEALLMPLKEVDFSWSRLTIVPYGFLHGVAFHLLRYQEAYLIEQAEVVILPTASLRIRAQVVAPSGAQWVGHSYGGRLPLAVTEVQQLQARWGGTLAIDSEAQSNLVGKMASQILHLSSHGIHHVNRHFDRSYLHFHDGDIYSDDVLQRGLQHELVTLSACEVGLAKVAPGDELVGLGHAFLYAGAGALVASLWQVREEMAFMVMERFYNHLFGGMTKAEALRQAQLNVLTQAPNLHPAFWGAFQLVGDAGRLSTS